jgi:formamidopyrimidine-DNA glycosylase
MPELPEIAVLAAQMTAELTGKTVAAVHVRQPKCLNVSPEELAAGLVGRILGETRQHGKWLVTAVTGGADSDGDSRLAINLGMGGDLLYHQASPSAPGQAPFCAETAPPVPDQQQPEQPAQYQVRMDFADGSALTARFWWFGHVHLIGGQCGGGGSGPGGRDHPTMELGPSPLDLTGAEFAALISRSKASGVKSFILDQRRLAGVGNVYAQDPLWIARIHPLRKAGSLSREEVSALYAAICSVLKTSIAKGGLQYERDLYGNRGGYGRDDYAVAYREGEACPRCGGKVTKIKTGSTSTHICPACQVI